MEQDKDELTEIHVRALAGMDATPMMGRWVKDKLRQAAAAEKRQREGETVEEWLQHRLETEERYKIKKKRLRIRESVVIGLAALGVLAVQAMWLFLLATSGYWIGKLVLR